MFGRKKESLQEELDREAHPERPGAKNRPTPKRREQEAARRKPLVETDRRAARARDRDARRAAMTKQRAAMQTGDERGLPARDRGPVKRFIRDFVDARFNLGEFLLPIMLLVLLMSFVRTYWAVMATIILVYGLIIVAVLDAFLLWRRTKRAIIAKFGEDAVPRGAAMYTIMRSFQMRRLRMPRPMVNRDGTPVAR